MAIVWPPGTGEGDTCTKSDGAQGWRLWDASCSASFGDPCNVGTGAPPGVIVAAPSGDPVCQVGGLPPAVGVGSPCEAGPGGPGLPGLAGTYAAPSNPGNPLVCVPNPGQECIDAQTGKFGVTDGHQLCTALPAGSTCHVSGVAGLVDANGLCVVTAPAQHQGDTCIDQDGNHGKLALVGQAYVCIAAAGQLCDAGSGPDTGITTGSGSCVAGPALPEGTPCTTDAGYQGKADKDGACVYVPPPPVAGVSCMLPSGGTGVTDDKGACTSPAAPSPAAPSHAGWWLLFGGAAAFGLYKLATSRKTARS